MGSVTIERRRGPYRDLFRAYTVELNGKDVASLKPGETVSLALEPGDGHVVRLTIDWCSSPILIVQGDEDTQLVCGPARSALFAVFDVFGRPGEYIALKRA